MQKTLTPQLQEKFIELILDTIPDCLAVLVLTPLNSVRRWNLEVVRNVVESRLGDFREFATALLQTNHKIALFRLFNSFCKKLEEK